MENGKTKNSVYMKPSVLMHTRYISPPIPIPKSTSCTPRIPKLSPVAESPFSRTPIFTSPHQQ